MLPSRQSVAGLVALAVVTVFAACGRSGGSITQERATPAGDPGEIAGTEWVLRALNGHNLVEGTNITLEFNLRERGRVYGL